MEMFENKNDGQSLVLHKTQSTQTAAANMIHQVLKLGWNVSLLPSLIVKNQTATKHHQQLTSKSKIFSYLPKRHVTETLSVMYQNLLHQLINDRITSVLFCDLREIGQYTCVPTAP